MVNMTGILMMQWERLKMDDIISRINHALDMGRNRLRWYVVTRDEALMVQCREWNNIANMYMNELIRKQKNDD